MIPNKHAVVEDTSDDEPSDDELSADVDPPSCPSGTSQVIVDIENLPTPPPRFSSCFVSMVLMYSFVSLVLIRHYN